MGGKKPHEGQPRDQHGSRHVCMDETAIVVGGAVWLCNCPGGPYFTTAEAVRNYRRDLCENEKIL